MHCAPCTPEKTFCVVENRCLQCVESIFVNLPQFVKSGVKESLNRFSWYFWSGIEPFCFWVFVSLQNFRWRCHQNVRLEDCFDGGRQSTLVSLIHFLNLWTDGKDALGWNSTDTMFAEFLLHWMFNCKQRSCWNQLKAKQGSQSNMNNALFNLTYEVSDILNVNLASGVSWHITIKALK